MPVNDRWATLRKKAEQKKIKKKHSLFLSLTVLLDFYKPSLCLTPGRVFAQHSCNNTQQARRTDKHKSFTSLTRLHVKITCHCQGFAQGTALCSFILTCPCIRQGQKRQKYVHVCIWVCVHVLTFGCGPFAINNMIIMSLDQFIRKV